VTEVCFLNTDGTADCFYPGVQDPKKKTAVELMNYTAFSVENAQRVNGFINKCLKAGVRP